MLRKVPNLEKRFNLFVWQKENQNGKTSAIVATKKAQVEHLDLFSINTPEFFHAGVLKL